MRELECSELGAYSLAVAQLNDEDGGVSFWLKNYHPYSGAICSRLYLPLKLPQSGCSVIVVI